MGVILNDFVIDKIVNLFIFSYLFMVQLINILFNLYNLFKWYAIFFFFKYSLTIFYGIVQILLESNS